MTNEEDYLSKLFAQQPEPEPEPEPEAQPGPTPMQPENPNQTPDPRPEAGTHGHILESNLKYELDSPHRTCGAPKGKRTPNIEPPKPTPTQLTQKLEELETLTELTPDELVKITGSNNDSRFGIKVGSDFGLNKQQSRFIEEYYKNPEAGGCTGAGIRAGYTKRSAETICAKALKEDPRFGGYYNYLREQSSYAVHVDQDFLQMHMLKIYESCMEPDKMGKINASGANKALEMIAKLSGYLQTGTNSLAKNDLVQREKKMDNDLRTQIKDGNLEPRQLRLITELMQRGPGDGGSIN